jgi:hypothetical protein
MAQHAAVRQAAPWWAGCSGCSGAEPACCLGEYECLLIFDERTLLVDNDSNFPMSAGRTPGRPDDNEIITIRLGSRLGVDRRVLQ